MRSHAPTGVSAARSERGGAVSLWVLLMVPVAAFAAVVAMAVPQRLAAESSMQEAADDLAMLAVAGRDGHGMPSGPLPAFPPQCAGEGTSDQQALNSLELDIGAVPSSEKDPTVLGPLQDRLNNLLQASGMLERVASATDQAELQAWFDEFVVDLERASGWEAACEALFEALGGDLGSLGADLNSLRGSYSDSLKLAEFGVCSIPSHTRQNCVPNGGTWIPSRVCSDRSYVTRQNCVPNGGTWIPSGVCSDRSYVTRQDCETATETWMSLAVPCWTVAQVAGEPATVVRDAVHVAVAARWQDAGWAAAQVWPDGLPMAAESVGRLSRQVGAAHGLFDCGELLAVLDSQGRPAWEDDPEHLSREMSQSVGRNPLPG